MSHVDLTVPSSRRILGLDADLALRAAGLVLFAEAAQFMLVMMLAGAIAPGYSLNAGAISDLGAIPETATLFNTSLVAVGVLNIAAAALLHRWHRSRWITGLVVAAGVGAAGAGIVNLGMSPDAHGLMALLAFLGFSLMPAAIAVKTSGLMRVLSGIAAVVSIAFVIIMIIGDAGDPAIFGAIGHGGAERMIVYPVMLWLMAFGGYLIGVRTPSSSTR